MKGNATAAISSDDFSRADISGLKNDVPRNADSLEEAYTKLRNLHIERVERDKVWRERLL